MTDYDRDETHLTPALLEALESDRAFIATHGAESSLQAAALVGVDTVGQARQAARYCRDAYAPREALAIYYAALEGD